MPPFTKCTTWSIARLEPHYTLTLYSTIEPKRRCLSLYSNFNAFSRSKKKLKYRSKTHKYLSFIVAHLLFMYQLFLDRVSRINTFPKCICSVKLHSP